jgi:hypothetical protein
MSTVNQAEMPLFGGSGSTLGLVNEGVSRLGFEADYETRQIYFLGMYEHLLSPTLFKQETVKLRGGFAPYLGDFSELNTWFIVQADYDLQTKGEVDLTPYFRFYYKNILWEIGSSIKTGDLSLTLMVHL